MHVQICCFVYKAYCLFFLRSRCRPRRWILKSLLTTLPMVVTTKPFSRHKYSAPQTFLVLTHLITNLLRRLKPLRFLLLHITLHCPLNVAHIIHKHSHVLYSSERCRNVFKNLLIVSYCHSNNLSGILC